MVSQGEMESKDLLDHQENMDYQDPLDRNQEGPMGEEHLPTT